MIAHRLATVEASDRILVLRRGELIEQGTHQELSPRRALCPARRAAGAGVGTFVTDSLPMPAEPLVQQYGLCPSLPLRQ